MARRTVRRSRVSPKRSKVHRAMQTLILRSAQGARLEGRGFALKLPPLCSPPARHGFRVPLRGPGMTTGGVSPIVPNGVCYQATKIFVIPGRRSRTRNPCLNADDLCADMPRLPRHPRACPEDPALGRGAKQRCEISASKDKVWVLGTSPRMTNRVEAIPLPDYIALIHKSPPASASLSPISPASPPPPTLWTRPCHRRRRFWRLRSKIGRRPSRAGWMSCAAMRNLRRCPRMRLWLRCAPKAVSSEI